MSVAFTKEDSAETASETILPDRPISAHPNLVTEQGLQALKDQLDAARLQYEVAHTLEEANDRRRSAAIPLRDIRYLTSRLRSAQVVKDPVAPLSVTFGSVVTMRRQDRRVTTYRIVGEDEADPKLGTISYVSPVARRLLGRNVGDIVESGNDAIEILSISEPFSSTASGDPIRL